MKEQVTVLILLAGALIATPSFAGPAGCCGSDTSAMTTCPGMASHDSPAAAPSATQIKLPQQVALVFDSYSRIQTSLAKDSLEGVAESSLSIAKAAKEDASGTLPTNLAQKSEAVANAADLASARKAFKSLSGPACPAVFHSLQLVTQAWQPTHTLRSITSASWVTDASRCDRRSRRASGECRGPCRAPRAPRQIAAT